MISTRALFLTACLAVVVPAFSPFLANASEPAKQAPAQGPTISTILAVRGMISDTVTVGGTLVPKEEILVAAQVDGLAIVAILTEEGAHVRKGDILARLSRESIDIAIAQNKAQIARTEAAIAQAKAQIADAEAAKVAAMNSFNRAKDLRAGGITTAETFDQRQSLAQQTAARVTSAQQTLKLAEADKAVAEAQSAELALRLLRTDIKSPSDGIVSRRSARLGAIAAGAADPLFRIIENGTIELEADVTEANLIRLKNGQSANVRPAGLANDLRANIRLVSPEVSRTTRLGRVRLTIHTDQRLPIGSFARGSIEVAKSDGIVLPLSAVQFAADGPKVQVVTNGVVETRAITVGLRSSTMAEITAGLKLGEQVVSIAGTFLRNGDQITPVPAAVSPPAAVN